MSGYRLGRTVTSSGPMMWGDLMPAAPVPRLGELVATFALAQDDAFGQPLESQLRSCLLATWMAEEAGYLSPGAQPRGRSHIPGPSSLPELSSRPS